MTEDNESRNLNIEGSSNRGIEFESKEEIFEFSECGCIKFFNVSLSFLKDVYAKISKEITPNLLLTLALLADEDLSLVSEEDRALTAEYRLNNPGHIYFSAYRDFLRNMIT